MEVIDLLNRIANREEVPLIKCRGKILHWNKEKDRFEDKDGMNILYEIDFSELNNEVEIIEEDKKIRKLPKEVRQPNNFEEVVYIAEDLVNKINEIIDYIKEEK